MAKKGERKPTTKQRKYVDGLMKGKSKRKAALEAGYAESVANSACEKIEAKPSVQNLFAQTLVKAGITDELLATRIREGIDAEETEFAKFEGTITDSRNVVAWGERRAYVELAAKIKGYLSEKHIHAGDPDAPLFSKLILVDAGSES